MRDLALVLSFVFFLPLSIPFPFTGVLVWGWLSLMNPHREVYGFALGQPFNFAVAVVTIGAWLFSREPKRFPPGALPWLMVAFAIWMTLNSFFAVDPSWSWPLWERTIKIFVFVFLVMMMMNSKARIHAMVWVVVLSIGYFGVKGGLFTIASGGGARVFGPPDSILSDNNQLAVAIGAALPLVNYLRMHTANRWLRWGLAAAMAIQVITIFGTYSRGGVIALAAGASVFWLRSRHKMLYLTVGAVVLVAGLSVMPDSFWERMGSIGNAAQDSSFMGRVYAWRAALYYAIDHFPLGAGFAGPQLNAVFNHYFPDVGTHAAHSIYFQVLGEHGFPALGLYLLIIASAFRNTFVTIRHLRDRPGYGWAGDLARMSQVSLVTFCVGGGALSMAYYDGFFITVALTSALRVLSDPESEKN